MTARSLLAALALIGLGSLACADDPKPLPVKERSVKMTSGGADVRVDVYAPARAGKLSVVVLLHGADGLAFESWVQVYGSIAKRVAARGYLLAVPHYFERTGHGGKIADPLTMLRNYPTWADTVGDALTFAGKLPEADPDRLAVIGVSLGGTLAIDTAAKDKRVKVLIDYFGGFPGVIAGRVQRLPPTLILHGEKDGLVPVKDSERLDALLTRLKVEHELKVYPGQGHGFVGADEKDALDRTARFLGKHLAPPAK